MPTLFTREFADMALTRADGMAERFYGMSAQIEAKGKEYHLQRPRHLGEFY